jgi:hypothetical protein
MIVIILARLNTTVQKYCFVTFRFCFFFMKASVFYNIVLGKLRRVHDEHVGAKEPGKEGVATSATDHQLHCL